MKPKRKREPMPIPVKAPCGHDAVINSYGDKRYFVTCDDAECCWMGPERSSKRRAIEVWNERMEK